MKKRVQNREGEYKMCVTDERGRGNDKKDGNSEGWKR